jgi:hypothetical protein
MCALVACSVSGFGATFTEDWRRRERWWSCPLKQSSPSPGGREETHRHRFISDNWPVESDDLRQRSERYAAEQNYTDDAIATHRALLAAVPGDPPTTNRLGIALLKRGLLDEAEAVLRTQAENPVARKRLQEIDAARRPRLAPVKGPRPTGRPPQPDDHEDWPNYVEHDRDAIRELFDNGTDNWRDGLRLIAEVAPNRLTYRRSNGRSAGRRAGGRP